VNVSYSANEARDISLEFKTPIPDDQFINYLQVTVPAGELDTSLVLTINEALPVAENYRIILSLREVGKEVFEFF